MKPNVECRALCQAWPDFPSSCNVSFSYLGVIVSEPSRRKRTHQAQNFRSGSGHSISTISDSYPFEWGLSTFSKSSRLGLKSGQKTFFTSKMLIRLLRLRKE